MVGEVANDRAGVRIYEQLGRIVELAACRVVCVLRAKSVELAGTHSRQISVPNVLAWTVELDERRVIIGPNGAGKTTLLQRAGAIIHPTQGDACVLGERLGNIDVFEFHPRIGFTSAALAQRIPNSEKVLDIVVS